jgi:hypothetical protein
MTKYSTKENLSEGGEGPGSNEGAVWMSWTGPLCENLVIHKVLGLNYVTSE